MKRWPLVFLLTIIAGVALLLSPGAGRAQDSAPDNASGETQAVIQGNSDDYVGEEYNEQTLRAIDKGINFLASTQNKTTGAWERGVTLVATSQAALALMANGHTLGRGAYGKQVEKAVEFVMSTQRPDGFFNYRGGSRMYEHGFCTLFLCEAFGTSSDEGFNKKIRASIQKAINLIVSTQGDYGGWNYSPTKGETDLSITICQTMALRAARTCGIKIPIETIKKVMKCMKEAANTDGGISYRLPNKGPSAPPRTAAGVCILQALGRYKDKETINALKYLEKQTPTSGGSFFFYYNYYAAHAMYQAGPIYWKKWWPQVRDVLVREQLSNGSWADKDSGGDVYSTGMAMIVLQIPYRALPIIIK